jgi:hypothetical protein
VIAPRNLKRTANAGYRNRHAQIVLYDTGIPGTDYRQRIYALQCEICGHVYGTNGSDIFQRKCPAHQNGEPGLPADLGDFEPSGGSLEFVCYRQGDVYRDTAASTKKAADEFLRWFDADGHSIPNSGGVRWRDFIEMDVTDPDTKRAVPAYFVLVTVHTRSQFQKPWEDIVGVSEIAYHGDAKHHARKQKYDDFQGNQRLEAADNVRRGGTAPIPPILHFTKFKTGWVQFNGLCFLRGIDRETFNDGGHAVENLVAQLTILDAPAVLLRWLRSRALATKLEDLDRLAPKVWKAAIAGTILPNLTPHAAATAALMNRRVASSAPTLPDFEFDPQNDEDGREKVASQICRRRGQPRFRKQLLYLYGRRCAISGCSVVELLEACHIKPYMGPRTNHPCNGMLLRADLHTLFDLGLISIDTSTMSVLVSGSLNETEYATLRGRTIRLPHGSELGPSIGALDEHRNRHFDRLRFTDLSERSVSPRRGGL